MVTSLRLSTRGSRRNPPIFELAVNKVIKETFVKTYNLCRLSGSSSAPPLHHRDHQGRVKEITKNSSDSLGIVNLSLGRVHQAGQTVDYKAQ